MRGGKPSWPRTRTRRGSFASSSSKRLSSSLSLLYSTRWHHANSSSSSNSSPVSKDLRWGRLRPRELPTLLDRIHPLGLDRLQGSSTSRRPSAESCQLILVPIIKNRLFFWSFLVVILFSPLLKIQIIPSPKNLSFFHQSPQRLNISMYYQCFFPSVPSPFPKTDVPRSFSQTKPKTLHSPFLPRVSLSLSQTCFWIPRPTLSLLVALSLSLAPSMSFLSRSLYSGPHLQGNILSLVRLTPPPPSSYSDLVSPSICRHTLYFSNLRSAWKTADRPMYLSLSLSFSFSFSFFCG